MASAIGSELGRRLGAIALGMALLGGATAARAEATADEKAAAEALFDQAKDLAMHGHFADACPKFAESQRLDPGIGTMLYLADCYESSGRTASAWAQFREAAAAAKAANQPDREKKARDRAAALEGRLSRLSVVVPIESEVPGLTVKRDGTALGRALWGTPVPVDPGDHAIVVSAPGKKTWTSSITVKSGDTTPIAANVPLLENLPPEIVEPPKVETPKVEAPKQEAPKQDAPKQDAPKPIQQQPLPPPVPRDVPPPSKPSSPGQVAGGVLTGVGGAGVLAGGIVGMVALLKNNDSASNCKPSNACNADGTDQRKSARGLATVSNITLIAGGALFATGIITLIATKDPSRSGPLVLKASPLIGSSTGGIVVGGAW